MKKLEIPPEKVDFDSSKLIKKIIIAVICFVVFIVLLATGNVIFLLQVFGWLENQVRVLTGLDTLIVKGIVALLMSLLFILPIGGFIWSFFPVPQKNKKTKRFTVMAIFAVIFFASYLSSRNVFFSPETGEPLKYYSLAFDGGYNFYSSEGYDPLTGDKLIPISKDVIAKYMEKKSGINKDTVGGLESELKTYPVVFINQTGQSIFLCISTRLNIKESIVTRVIFQGDGLRLELLEGKHLFSCLSASGEGIKFLLDSLDIELESADHKREMNGEYIQFLAVEINSVRFCTTDIYILNVFPREDFRVCFRQNKIFVN